VPRRFSDVEELTGDHLLGDFDCGSDAQTIWLREHAVQAQSGRTAKVYVVRRIEDDRVVGFYSISSGGALTKDAPSRVTKGAGRYPVPVVILTRLGVDLSEQTGGLGRALVKDAFLRINFAADHIGIRAILIHVEDEQALGFYQRIAEFEPSPTDPLHLFLLLKDMRKVFEGE
jgi:hypothetical protein